MAKVFEVKSGGARMEVHASSLRAAINEAIHHWEATGKITRSQSGLAVVATYIKDRGEEYEWAFRCYRGDQSLLHIGFAWMPSNVTRERIEEECRAFLARLHDAECVKARQRRKDEGEFVEVTR